MPPVLMTFAGAETSGGTTYVAVQNGSGSESPVAEGIAQVVVRTAATYSKMWVYVGQNGLSTASTLTFRNNNKAGGNGNQTISIAAGVTGALQDTTHTDTVAVADKIDVKVVAGTYSTAALIIHTIALLLNQDSVRVGIGGYAWEYTTASHTINERIFAIYGMGGSLPDDTSPEANHKHQMRGYGRFQNLQINISIASGTTNNATFRLRKNGANGSQSISVTKNTTGIYEDTSNTDSFVPTDLFNFSFTTGSGTVDYGSLARSVEVQSISQPMGAGTTGYDGGVGVHESVQAKSLGYYYYPCGALIPGITVFGTETYGETQANFLTLCRSVATNLETYLTTNTVTAATTVKLRAGGISRIVLSVTASTTGFFEDTADSYDVEAGVNICYLVSTGGTGTQIGLQYIGHTQHYWPQVKVTAWKNPLLTQLNIGGVWKDISRMLVNVGSSWKIPE